MSLAILGQKLASLKCSSDAINSVEVFEVDVSTIVFRASPQLPKEIDSSAYLNALVSINCLWTPGNT